MKKPTYSFARRNIETTNINKSVGLFVRASSFLTRPSKNRSGSRGYGSGKAYYLTNF